jgi:phytoene dehydrogenase-like protein
MDRVRELFDLDLEGRASAVPLRVHLPDGRIVNRYSEAESWRGERIDKFGSSAEAFWSWQKKRALQLWSLTEFDPPWPPQNISDFLRLLETGGKWIWNTPGALQVIGDAFRSVQRHNQNQSEAFQQYLDGQLLISSQAPSEEANALFGAAALDLYNTGILHFQRGMGAIAHSLVEAIQNSGGEVHYRHQVQQVDKVEGGFRIGINSGEMYTTRQVVFNLTPWGVRKIAGFRLPKRFRSIPAQPEKGWGAFMVYAGLPADLIPEDFPLHHQVLTDQTPGEKYSVFLSLSPAWDDQRAPAGRRALTISTHTKLQEWWNPAGKKHQDHQQLRKAHLDFTLDAAERVIPGLRENAELILPGTPHTFQRFTGRPFGWVGGFPQINLFQNWGSRITKGTWMVGDSIFPGQSVPAAALGGIRVAKQILKSLE